MSSNVYFLFVNSQTVLYYNMIIIIEYNLVMRVKYTVMLPKLSDPNYGTVDQDSGVWQIYRKSFGLKNIDFSLTRSQKLYGFFNRNG